MSDFIRWLRENVNSQATPDGNAVCVDDYWPDGKGEYCYPKECIINGDRYSWHIGSYYTRGRHLCTHYELRFYGPAFQGSMKIATGLLGKTKFRKGFRMIYEYYELAPDTNTERAGDVVIGPSGLRISVRSVILKRKTMTHDLSFIRL